jgi:hypothetical protein
MVWQASEVRYFGNRMTTLRLAVFITVAFCQPVEAADVWTCSYPGWPDGHAIIDRFREVNGFFVEDTFKLKYQILQNNQYGVVAVWSFSDVENGSPGILGRTIVINKATGDFLMENASITEPDSVNRPNRGKCLKD